MSKNYDILDLTKFFAAILVVGIHTAAFSDINPLMYKLIFETIGRLGVPVFFIISSYFLSKKIKSNQLDSNEIIEKYSWRILQLYLFWFVFNWKWIWQTWFVNTDSVGIQKLGKFIIGLFFQSSFSGSWYLTSSVFSAIFYYLILKRFDLKEKLMITSIIFMMVSLGSINLQIPIVSALGKLAYLPTSVFVGPIYFAIGDLIYQGKKLTQRQAAIGLAISIILWIIELKFTKIILISKDELFIYPIIGYFLISLLLTIDVKIKHARTLRQLSTIIYLSQFSFIFMNRGLPGIMNLSATGIFVLTIVQTITLGFLIFKLRKLEQFQWLKLAY